MRPSPAFRSAASPLSVPDPASCNLPAPPRSSARSTSRRRRRSVWLPPGELLPTRTADHRACIDEVNRARVRFIGTFAAMDYVRSVEVVIPGVQGRVLGVLARSDAELTMRTVGKLAGVSSNRAAAVLNHLVSLGLVERREAGSAALVRLARDNEAARAVLALAGLRETVIRQL